FAASVITTITYGLHVPTIDHWIVKENMEAINWLPWLLKLPILMQLAWQRRLQWFRPAAEERRKRQEQLYVRLLDDAKTRMRTTLMPDCISTQVTNDQEKTGMSYIEIAYTLASSFGAGFETTSASIETFIFSMLHFPDAMKKAQEELDRVVGSDRMPEFGDKDNLPYTNALIKETMRWRPVAAFGAAAHAVTVDDEYNGM
ncbi:hypothetical protein H0H93_009598, partial [Arthromyces matolae]